MRKFKQPSIYNIPEGAKIEIYTDGCCIPTNPGGHMGYGYVVYANDEEVYTESGFTKAHESNSNNLSEYMALEGAMSWLRKQFLTGNKVLIRSDSQLMVKQMIGLWQIKNGAYADKAKELRNGLEDFTELEFEWIPREQNKYADQLSRQGLIDAGLLQSEETSVEYKGLKITRKEAKSQIPNILKKFKKAFGSLVGSELTREEANQMFMSLKFYEKYG